MDNVELVKSFLRGQNLEQVGRREEAIELYERIIEARFDSTGPYDRLIALYGDDARHADVMRITEAALEHVQTHDQKRQWYTDMSAAAAKAAADVPQAAPKRRPPIQPE